jgi:hypothetical protein
MNPSLSRSHYSATRSQMVNDRAYLKKRLLATAAGLIAGGILFHRFGFDRNGEIYGWQCYQGAVLLAAMGLAGLLPESSQIAAIALGIAPSLVFCYEIVYLHPVESMWPIVLPFLFLSSLPIPIIGSELGRFLARTRVPRTAYLFALAGALIVGALLPGLQNLQLQRIETKTAELLKQIHQAEMTYSAHQPERTFVCNGTLLPGPAGKLAWRRGELGDYLVVDFYTIGIDCPNNTNPPHFRLTAKSNDGSIRAPDLSMDETGKLVVAPVGLAIVDDHPKKKKK